MVPSGANLGPQEPGGPHIGPMNLAIWDIIFLPWQRPTTFWCSFPCTHAPDIVFEIIHPRLCYINYTNALGYWQEHSKHKNNTRYSQKPMNTKTSYVQRDTSLSKTLKMRPSLTSSSNIKAGNLWQTRRVCQKANLCQQRTKKMAWYLNQVLVPGSILGFNNTMAKYRWWTGGPTETFLQ